MIQVTELLTELLFKLTLSRLGRSRRGQIFHRSNRQKFPPVRAGNGFNRRTGFIYSADDKSAPSKYRGIGIRIEDDVLVTEKGNFNLTNKVPKDADAIEELMNSTKAKSAKK